MRAGWIEGPMVMGRFLLGGRPKMKNYEIKNKVEVQKSNKGVMRNGRRRKRERERRRKS